MVLVDKVLAEMSSVDYRARECLDSGRMQLEHRGRSYCVLSHPDTDVYCPLQKQVDSARMSECRRREYLEEFAERALNKG